MAVNQAAPPRQASRLKATLATFAGISSTTLIVSVQAIILMPMYLNALGPRLYGAWLGSGDILFWLQALDLGLPNLIAQRIGAAHAQSDDKSVAEYFASGLFVLFFVSLIIFAASLGMAGAIASHFNLPVREASTLKWCFILGSLAAAINVFLNAIIGFSRGVQSTAFLNLVNVFCSLGGFAVSGVLIVTGFGLWSIAWGLLTRSLISAAGCLWFSLEYLSRAKLWAVLRVRRQLLAEFTRVAPATAVGTLSYAAMTQSESAIVAFFVRPELATVFVFTRKAIDLVRGLVDMIGVATYASFAHLVMSDQAHRAQDVHRLIRRLRAAAALAFAVAYMVVNRSLVSTWAASAQFGGPLLTILIALYAIATTGSYLLNYLYRATGPIVHGSVMLIAESALRLPLMVLFLKWLGLPGLPLAGVVTATGFGYLALSYTRTHLNWPPAKTSFISGAVRFGLFVLAALYCWLGSTHGWTFVLLAGSATVCASAGIQVFTDARIRAWAGQMLVRLRTAGALT